MLQKTIKLIGPVMMVMLMGTSTQAVAALPPGFKNMVSWTKDLLPCHEKDEITTQVGAYSDEVFHVFVCRMPIAVEGMIIGELQVVQLSRPDKVGGDGPTYQTVLSQTKIRVFSAAGPLVGFSLESVPKLSDLLRAFLEESGRISVMGSWDGSDKVTSVTTPTRYTDDASHYATDETYHRITQWYDGNEVSEEWFAEQLKATRFIRNPNAFRISTINYCLPRHHGRPCRDYWRTPHGGNPAVQPPRKYR